MPLGQEASTFLGHNLFLPLYTHKLQIFSFPLQLNNFSGPPTQVLTSQAHWYHDSTKGNKQLVLRKGNYYISESRKITISTFHKHITVWLPINFLSIILYHWISISHTIQVPKFSWWQKLFSPNYKPGIQSGDGDSFFLFLSVMMETT